MNMTIELSRQRGIICSISLASVYTVFNMLCVFDTKHRCFAQFRESSVSSVCPAEVWAASAGGPGGVEAEGKLSSLNKPPLSDLISSTSAPETFSSGPTRCGELKPRFNYRRFIFPHVKDRLSAHGAILPIVCACVQLMPAYFIKLSLWRDKKKKKKSGSSVVSARVVNCQAEGQRECLPASVLLLVKDMGVKLSRTICNPTILFPHLRNLSSVQANVQ